MTKYPFSFSLEEKEKLKEQNNLEKHSNANYEYNFDINKLMLSMSCFSGAQFSFCCTWRFQFLDCYIAFQDIFN